MAMDYHKSNQIVSPIAAAVSSMLSLLEQISRDSGTWYVASDLADRLFFYPLSKRESEIIDIPLECVTISIYSLALKLC